jgi:hypothetical protein
MMIREYKDMDKSLTKYDFDGCDFGYGSSSGSRHGSGYGYGECGFDYGFDYGFECGFGWIKIL